MYTLIFVHKKSVEFVPCLSSGFPHRNTYGASNLSLMCLPSKKQRCTDHDAW